MRRQTLLADQRSAFHSFKVYSVLTSICRSFRIQAHVQLGSSFQGIHDASAGIVRAATTGGAEGAGYGGLFGKTLRAIGLGLGLVSGTIEGGVAGNWGLFGKRLGLGSVAIENGNRGGAAHGRSCQCTVVYWYRTGTVCFVGGY